MKQNPLIRKLRYLTWAILALLLMSNKSRQALKALEEGDFDKAIEYLEKSIEKDSLNPNIAYVYAVLYSTDSFPEYDLDRSHVYILAAIQMLDLMTDDHQKEMERAELTTETFHDEKRKIDSLAWVRAKSQNQIGGYQFFLESYGDSKYIEAAIGARHVLEFEITEKKDTWQAYQLFMKDFPDAVQVPIAKERFDRLIYEFKTQSNQLGDLEDFLIEYPTTPYRSEIEQRIFDLIWKSLDIDRYYHFINTHNNEGLTKVTFGLLYHLGELDRAKLKPFNVPAYEAFEDSVKAIEALNQQTWIPVYENGKYNWMDPIGNPQELAPTEFISKAYLCGKVDQTLLAVGNKEEVLINRQGSVIYDQPFDEYKEAGNGVVVLRKDSLQGAIHVSGSQLLPFEFSDIMWLGGRLFACKSDEKYALYNFGGERLTSFLFDNVSITGDQYWVFEKDEYLAVSTYDRLTQMIDSGQFELNYEYEEFELIRDKYLIGYEEDYEVLYNPQLQVVSPPNTYRINTRYDHWVFETESGLSAFNSTLDAQESEEYDEVIQNDEWLGLRREGQWEVRSKTLNTDPIVAVDSLKLLGDDIAIVFRDDHGMAIFPNKEIVYISEGDQLASISDPLLTSAHYLVLIRNGKSNVYKDGKLLFSTEHDEVDFITEKGFLVKEKDKYGAVNAKGHLIMRIRYDAIAEPVNGVASVLYKGKFGGFNFDDKILINLSWDSKLIPYNEELFVMKEEGLVGLISKKNQVVVEPEFDEIHYWSDTAFMAKEDGQWLILTMDGQEELLEGVEDYEILVETAKTKTLMFYTKEGMGVYDSRYGLVVPPVYNEVINLGTAEQPLYFAEKSFPEAGYHIVVYYDLEGRQVRKGAYTAEEINKVWCDR